MMHLGSARANARLALMLVLALSAAVLGGCKEDDDGKAGGGTIILPDPFPPIPDDRPDLALPVTLDASGAGGAAGQFSGSGGRIEVVAGAGEIMPDDGRAEPAISSNFLTAAVLADNVVSYGELIAIDPANVTGSAGITVIDLSGSDFYLPGAATLDLGDAPASATVIIRAMGADDTIRIDGTVIGTHPTLFAMSVTFVSAGGGTAISVSGSINVSGTTANADAGNVALIAEMGDVLVRGTITANGAQPAAGVGGEGGDISIAAAQGDALLAPGIWQANGGSGSHGGSGGSILADCAGDMEFRWGVRANSGLSSGGDSGGAGNAIIESDTTLEMFVAFELNGGASTTGIGGSGGSFQVYGWFVTGVAAGTANGGSGVGAAGGGGNVALNSENMAGVALDVTADGGSSTGVAGGFGGYVSAYTDGQYYVNVLVDGRARGGAGGGTSAAGGAGGFVSVQGYGLQSNVQLVSDVSGGNSLGSFGGAGGSTGVEVYSFYGEELELVLMTCIANGGNGTSGGNAGTVFINPGAGDNNNVTANITAVGGTGSVSDGGAGGFVEAEGNIPASEGSPVDWSMNLTLSGNAGGGQSSDANGGPGGSVILNANGFGGWYKVDTAGTFLVRGGNALGAGNGGGGGRLDVSAGPWKVFESDNFSFDMSGGNSVDGDGGPGGASFRSGPGFFCLVNGTLDIRGGTINISGGTATNLGVGGEGGEARINSFFGDINFAATLLVNGGDGAAGGGSGADVGEAVEFNADYDGDGIGGTIRISGAVRCNGGNCTGTNGQGGSSGFIWINNLYGSPMSGGDVFISGTLESAGGNGSGPQSGGGFSSGLEVSSSGSILNISGNILVRGGTADNGGGASTIAVGCSAITQVTISGMIETRGGSGPVSGGDGGQIDIGAPGFGQPPATITVAASGIVRSAAGSGGVTDGAAGFIELDAQGTGGANVSVAGAAIVEVLDGAGAQVPANVTID